MGAPQDQKEITMKKTLVLIRGIPGSGKTTMAKAMSNGVIKHPHYETDTFFTHPHTGEYRFSPGLIREAHQWCQQQVLKSLYHGEPKVIVSNTFTQIWELEPYLELAERFGYKVDIHTCTGEYTNVHGVPEEKVQEMKQRFEPTAYVKSPHFDLLTQNTITRVMEEMKDLKTWSEVMIKAGQENYDTILSDLSAKES